jgi:hypothetical protein
VVGLQLFCYLLFLTVLFLALNRKATSLLAHLYKQAQL